MHVRYTQRRQGCQQEGLRILMASVPRSERTAARQAAYRRGLALSPPSPGAAPGFPITDAGHWDKARRAVGRVKDPARRAQLGRLLRKTAPRFGKEKALGQSWAAGSSHANDGTAISLAVRAMRNNGQMMTCPECGHVAPAGDFGASGASLQKSPGLLRTPAPSTAGTRKGVPLAVRGGKAAHALANGDTRAALELAGTLTARRHAIRGPLDVLVARGQDGTAVLRHRHGGTEIAQIRKEPDGRWVATVNGRDLAPRDHQRTALMEAVGTWNKAIQAAVRPQDVTPLQGPPQQTELMREYGIPAIRALATPSTGASAGPRVTLAAGTYDPDKDGDDDASVSGDTDKDYAGALGPKGKAIYRKLRARGFTAQRALAFAKNADKGLPQMARAS
jgi:hypothetical protein